MHIFNSCTASLQHCLDTKTFAIAHLYNTEKTMDIHIHDCYEIYYSISGGIQFLIDQQVYNFQSGDIFFINTFEGHHVLHLNQEEYERIVIHVHPDYLTSLSTEQTDLTECFLNKTPFHNSKCSLSQYEQKRFMHFIHELSQEGRYGQDILDASTFLLLMVFLNATYDTTHSMNTKEDAVPQKNNEHLQQILSYINQHLSEELSVQILSEKLFLSSSYLCKIFKAGTGTTINKYISAQRITLAKSLLTQGYSVSDTCFMCGYRDYSCFLKAFTKAVGISPKKYAQFTT